MPQYYPKDLIDRIVGARRYLFNVTAYGADKTGNNDCSYAFNRAIAAAAANGIGDVFAPAGRYKVDSAITFSHNNVRIVGDGPGRTIIDAGSLSDTAVFSQGSVDTTNTLALSVDASFGDESITLSSVSGLSKGDWILLYSDAEYAPGESVTPTIGQLNQIKEINGSVLTIDSPVYGAQTQDGGYTTADNARVAKVSFVQNVGVVGVSIHHDLTHAGTARALGFRYCQNVQVEDVEVRSGGAFALYLADSQYVVGNRIRLVQSDETDAFDVSSSSYAIYGCTVAGFSRDVHLNALQTDRYRHGVIGGTSGFIGVVRHVTIDNSLFYASRGPALTAHITFDDLHVSNTDFVHSGTKLSADTLTNYSEMGVACDRGVNWTLTNCNFTGSDYGSQWKDCFNVKLIGCDFSHHATAMWIEGVTNLEIGGNTKIRHNQGTCVRVFEGEEENRNIAFSSVTFDSWGEAVGNYHAFLTDNSNPPTIENLSFDDVTFSNNNGNANANALFFNGACVINGLTLDGIRFVDITDGASASYPLKLGGLETITNAVIGDYNVIDCDHGLDTSIAVSAGDRSVFDTGILGLRGGYAEGDVGYHIPYMHAIQGSSSTILKWNDQAVASGDYVFLDRDVTLNGYGVRVTADECRRFRVYRDLEVEPGGSTVTAGRVYIRCFDATGSVLTGTSPYYAQFTAGVTTTGIGSFGGSSESYNFADESTAPVVDVQFATGVAYADIYFGTGGSGGEPCAIKSFRIDAIEDGNVQLIDTYPQVVRGAKIASEPPTSGTCYGLGDIIYHAAPTASGDALGWQVINIADSTGITTRLLSAASGAVGGGGGGVSWPVSDEDFGVSDNADPTKVMEFEVNQVSTGTTRTVTMADRNLDLDTPVFTNVDAGDYARAGYFLADTAGSASDPSFALSGNDDGFYLANVNTIGISTANTLRGYFSDSAFVLNYAVDFDSTLDVAGLLTAEANATVNGNLRVYGTIFNDADGYTRIGGADDLRIDKYGSGAYTGYLTQFDASGGIVPSTLEATGVLTQATATGFVTTRRGHPELLFNVSYDDHYSEITYNASGNVDTVDMWDTSGKATKLFTRTLVYNASGNVSTITTQDERSGLTLTKTLAYDATGNVSSVTTALA